jgi:flagellar FliL protein
VLVWPWCLAGPDSTPPGPALSLGVQTGIAFVPLDTMVVSLGADSGSSHLRFTAQVEVEDTAEADVTLLKPRILDVLNSYLRAIDTASIEDPQAMARLRAQMLRRVQIVTGEGRVRDLLITEFVLN